MKVTGTGKVPSSNVTAPNKESFENKKEAFEAKLKEGKDKIHTNPLSKVGDAALKTASKLLKKKIIKNKN